MQETAEPLIPADARKLIAQGAEARVWECNFLGRPAVVKQRFCKKYRHPELDAKLTPARLKQEVRSMAKARKLGLRTPCLYHVEMQSSSIYMERIQGRSVKQVLHDNALSPQGLKGVLAAIGQAVAVLHDAGIVHGDLTTSNMLLQDPDMRLVMIDFGLSYNSTIPEDKAVDLYVMERAFLSTHAQQEGLFDEVLTSYRRKSKQWSATLNKFAEVRLRGRKRAMVG